jgi:hypothetical protein
MSIATLLVHFPRLNSLAEYWKITPSLAGLFHFNQEDEADVISTMHAARSAFIPRPGVKILRDRGAQLEIIHPDEDSESAFASVGSPMNPAICEPSAPAARLQGRRLVSDRALWV